MAVPGSKPKALRAVSEAKDSSATTARGLACGQLHKWGQAVARTPLLYTTNPGDLVIDPFAGSGTTLYAAKTLGLGAIQLRYCEIAVKRLRQEALPFMDQPA